ncbi:MAG: large-conductance mechanosensitive channel protein MscL [Gemmataceae bacterium]
MGLIKEFKEFATRGNVVDLAVGVIIGGAFGTIVKSLVDDIMMPPIGWLTKGEPFAKMSIKLPLPGSEPVEIFVGRFINNVITFLIIAFCVFMVVKVMNRVLRTAPPPPAKPTKTEELLMEIRDVLKAKGA